MPQEQKNEKVVPKTQPMPLPQKIEEQEKDIQEGKERMDTDGSPLNPTNEFRKPVLQLVKS